MNGLVPTGIVPTTVLVARSTLDTTPRLELLTYAVVVPGGFANAFDAGTTNPTTTTPRTVNAEDSNDPTRRAPDTRVGASFPADRTEPMPGPSCPDRPLTCPARRWGNRNSRSLARIGILILAKNPDCDPARERQNWRHPAPWISGRHRNSSGFRCE
ncbi:hypothetical protein Acsp05_58640 [Actinokineospora sp. NBRC 105648]|nr:hypothetical protein Acsp05_58640 [Actinokineospora sp. NBRC 105648]